MKKKLMVLFVASMMGAQASDHALDERDVPGFQVHQYADENFLVELGVTREVARIVARDVARTVAGVVTEFVVRPWNPAVAEASKSVCLDLDGAGHSAVLVVDKSCDVCNDITRWWRR